MSEVRLSDELYFKGPNLMLDQSELQNLTLKLFVENVFKLLKNLSNQPSLRCWIFIRHFIRLKHWIELKFEAADRTFQIVNNH